MKTHTRLLLILFLTAPMITVRADDVGHARPIADVLAHAQRRDKVLIEGTVKRLFDFDTFLVNDGQAEMAVSFAGVRQNLKLHDAIVVYGKYDSRSGYETRYGLLNAIEWAYQTEPKAADLKNKYGRSGAPTLAPTPNDSTETVAPVPVSERTTESRLRELNELKDKGLISPAEYSELRKKILDGL